MISPILPLIAFAQDGSSEEPSLLAQMLPLILIVVIFYFLLIRPQQKRSKELREMLEKLTVGDEILTNSGILGTIVKIDDSVVLVNLGTTQIHLQRQSIQSILPKGSVPSSDNASR